ncbi:MAG: pantoate--beta-alanine ligase, partial [Chitinophagaceae bacterium]|nr:pantoate--beta-alanine ligase [Chitinophagaceae bacterium]
ALFLPSVAEMYPDGIKPSRHYDLGFLETSLEGEFRPGHFQGVCMVVDRLLNIVQPDHLYLGQKDYQQCMVISRLVELIGMKDRIMVNVCPTLRETDGLAMSSRNMRLTHEDRKKAPGIYKSMCYIKEHLVAGATNDVMVRAKGMLADTGFRTDYLELVDATSLLPVSDWDGEQKLVILAAAFLGELRLIDNLLVN